MTEIAIPLKWFCYRQNNSGGRFIYDDSLGISVNVWVEARDAREADYRAERIGLYFDGAGDCPCCGDRWYSQSYYGEAADTPPEPDAPFREERWRHKWMDGYETFVHRYDGSFYGTEAQEGEIVEPREIENR